MEPTNKNLVNCITLAAGIMLFAIQMVTDLIVEPEYFTNFEDLVIIVLSIQLISSSLRSFVD